jgi:hypothetical protein
MTAASHSATFMIRALTEGSYPHESPAICW